MEPPAPGVFRDNTEPLRRCLTKNKKPIEAPPVLTNVWVPSPAQCTVRVRRAALGVVAG